MNNMGRKILVEVSEEELKELNKEKTLDDYVDGLINYFNTHNYDKVRGYIDPMSAIGITTKLYQTPSRTIEFSYNSDGVIYVKVERNTNDNN